MKKRKQKKIGSLSQKISNRLSYTIIAFVSLILLAVIVYAFGSVPNPGHSVSQLQGCDSSGQTLQWTGSAWACADIGGGSQNLAEVLAAGNNAGSYGIDMNNRFIRDVSTLSVNEISDPDDGTVTIAGADSLSISNGDLSVAGDIQANYGNIVLQNSQVKANNGFCIGSHCMTSWPSYIDWTDCEEKEVKSSGGTAAHASCSSGYKIVDTAMAVWGTDGTMRDISRWGDGGSISLIGLGEKIVNIKCCKLVTP